MNKYEKVIQYFANDFELALKGRVKLSNMDDKINNNNPALLTDISTLSELAFELRVGTLEIVETKPKGESK